MQMVRDRNNKYLQGNKNNLYKCLILLHFTLGTFGRVFERFSNFRQVFRSNATINFIIPLASSSSAKTKRKFMVII